MVFRRDAMRTACRGMLQPRWVKRATSGLQSQRGFVLPEAKDQVHDKTDLELVTWLVIKSS